MATKKTAAKVKTTVAKKPVKPVKAVKATTQKAEARKKGAAETAPLPGEEKLDIISQFATKQGDTGSPEVQIALLTKRIEKLVGHLKTNPQDNHSRRGLLGMVSKRRRLINYLAEKDEKRAKDVMEKLKLT